MRWILLAPLKLIGMLFVALGYLVAFLLGVGLVGGGTALILEGMPQAVIGAPAALVGFFVLRGLLANEARGACGREAPAAPGYAPPPPAYAPHSPAPAAHAPAGYAYAAYAPQPQAPEPQAPARCARGHDRHFTPRRAYYWVPGHWTVR